MNQILDDYNNRNPIHPDGTDKIVRVFAIIIMIFALALIGVVGYGMFKNNDTNETSKEEFSKANIKTSVDGEEAVIEVTHDVNIKELTYSWNSGNEKTIKGNGTTLKTSVEIPAGNNTLDVVVTDERDVQTTYSKEFFSENGVDIISPVIELSVTDEKKLRIVATDETALDFITYRWNEDEEQKVYADENSKEITTDIEIMKGENDFTVVAVDASQNTIKESKSFKGITKPEIKVTLSEDGSTINVKAVHENGIKSVKFNFNNNDYNVDIGNDNPKEIEFNQELETGYNRIILTVNSVDNTETVFDGECTRGDPSNTRFRTSNDEEEDINDEENSQEDEENEDNNQEDNDQSQDDE